MEQLRFTLPETLSLIGVFQCVYILVYVSFRAQKFSHVILPLLYFFVLGCGFFTDFARGYIGGLTPYYDTMGWGVWNYVLPLGVLLVIQMARISKLPPVWAWSVLALVPAALGFSVVMVTQGQDACSHIYECPSFMEWLNISGLVAGSVTLLLIWGLRGLFEDLLTQKAGQERYWLILSLIMVNICFLLSFAAGLSEGAYWSDSPLLRTVLGLAFSYIVSTSLFRIYPQALVFVPERKKDNELSADDRILVTKIENLLALEKIYHEPTYSRSNLAKEIGTPEGVVSRIINLHFGKSFPQLLNEYRIKDAKQLLLDTDASIKVVAEEVGFNSLPSFNRVFKEIEGRSPSDYRKNMIK